MPVEDVLENIRAKREEKGISKAAFARMLGLKQTTYLRIESGHIRLTLEMLEKIANALGVTSFELQGFNHSERVITEMDDETAEAFARKVAEEAADKAVKKFWESLQPKLGNGGGDKDQDGSTE